MTQLFNACEYLLDRRIAAGDGGRVALTGPAGELSYTQLWDRVRRTAAGLRAAGVQPEQRILMVMSDSPNFVVVYLAAMRVGAIPVPVSTMLRADGIAELLRDSRARFLAVTSEFAAAAESAAAAAPELAGVLSDYPVSDSPRPAYLLDDLAGAAPDDFIYDTSPDSPAFWLYTSGTTGTPKGAMHRHGASRSSARPTASGCSASVPATAACRRRRRSSRTASATRCCSRWRRARRACCCRRRHGRT